MTEAPGQLWTLAQTMIWACNAIGRFASPDEVMKLVDRFECRPPQRERSMGEAFMALAQSRGVLERAPMKKGPTIEVAGVGTWFGNCWTMAHEAIKRKLRDGDLQVFGRPREGERIPEGIGHLECQGICFKEDDTAPYAEYVDRSGSRFWDMVRLPARKVVELWPHTEAPSSNDGVTSDAPKEEAAPRKRGRPTGKDIVIAKAQERRDSGTTILVLADEARWLKADYDKRSPKGPPLSVERIADLIRKDHNANKAAISTK